MKRICGLETEHGTVFEEELIKLNLTPESYLMRELRDDPTFLLSEGGSEDEPKRSHWHNGAQIYLDCDKHYEVATPECTPDNISLYDAALSKSICEISPHHHALVYKNSIDDRLKTFGCHENYRVHHPLVHGKELEQLIFQKLGAFFVTRILFSGAGHLYEGKYYMSQQALGNAHLATTRTPSFYTSRLNEPFSEKGIRFHYTGGEANLSEIANYLKIGTTSLLLTLIESDASFFKDISNNADTCAKLWMELNQETNLFVKQEKTPIIEKAIEIQKYYQSCAQTFFDQNLHLKDAWTDDILVRWKNVLQQIKTRSPIIKRQVDWAIKHALIKSYAQQEQLELSDKRIEKASRHYHLLRPEGAYYVLRKAELVDTLFTAEELSSAQYNPPNTRAKARTEILRKMAKQHAVPQIIAWDRLRFLNPETNRSIEYLLPDPLALHFP